MIFQFFVRKRPAFFFMKENYISAVDEVVDLKAKIELLDYQVRSYDRSERLAWKRVHELENELNERNTIDN